MSMDDESLEAVTAYAIELARRRGAGEIGADDMIAGGLLALSRFGIVEIGNAIVDLEDLGLDWCAAARTRTGPKLAYSDGAVLLFDHAARIAKQDAVGGPAVTVEHLLVAGDWLTSDLLKDLHQRYGITSTLWRASLARRRASSAPQESSRKVRESAAAAPANGTVERDYLSPEEAARELGVHVQTLRAYIRSGKLPALRIAGERAIRIRRTDLSTVMEPVQIMETAGPEMETAN